MPLKLPEPLDAYFAAVNANEPVHAAACFTQDAIVHDEGSDRLGRDAIRDWVVETNRKYQFKAEARAVEQVADRTVVTAHISGQFPGSPIDLPFRFKIVAGQIARLDIG